MQYIGQLWISLRRNHCDQQGKLREIGRWDRNYAYSYTINIIIFAALNLFLAFAAQIFCFVYCHDFMRSRDVVLYASNWCASMHQCDMRFQWAAGAHYLFTYIAWIFKHSLKMNRFNVIPYSWFPRKPLLTYSAKVTVNTRDFFGWFTAKL